MLRRNCALLQRSVHVGVKRYRGASRRSSSSTTSSLSPMLLQLPEVTQAQAGARDGNWDKVIAPLERAVEVISPVVGMEKDAAALADILLLACHKSSNPVKAISVLRSLAARSKEWDAGLAVRTAACLLVLGDARGAGVALEPFRERTFEGPAPRVELQAEALVLATGAVPTALTESVGSRATTFCKNHLEDDSDSARFWRALSLRNSVVENGAGSEEESSSAVEALRESLTLLESVSSEGTGKEKETLERRKASFAAGDVAVELGSGLELSARDAGLVLLRAEAKQNLAVAIFRASPSPESADECQELLHDALFSFEALGDGSWIEGGAAAQALWGESVPSSAASSSSIDGRAGKARVLQDLAEIHHVALDKAVTSEGLYRSSIEIYEEILAPGTKALGRPAAMRNHGLALARYARLLAQWDKRDAESKRAFEAAASHLEAFGSDLTVEDLGIAHVDPWCGQYSDRWWEEAT